MSRLISLEGRALPIFFVTSGKVPFAGSHGYLDATADPDEIEKLALRFPGAKLVAVATGAISGIDVLDVDPRHGGDKWYFQHTGQLGRTRVHETRGGGWHLIFKHSPSLRSSANKLAPGAEFLSTGKLAVWWPAHAGRVLCEGPVAALPEWLHEALCAPRNGDAPKEREGWGLPMAGNGNGALPKPLYFEVLRLVPLSVSVTRRHQRWVIRILSDVTKLTEGRNHALNCAGFAFRPLLRFVPPETAERLLFSAAQWCGYVAKDGEHAALKTIRSGLGSISDIRSPHPFSEGNE
jgi:hypothetical protein